jgi:hypothetical protein
MQGKNTGSFSSFYQLMGISKKDFLARLSFFRQKKLSLRSNSIAFPDL